MLTPQQAISEKDALMQIFNPANPAHVKKLKQLTQTATGGRKTIKTASEMEGTGYYDPSGMYNFGGRGFTYAETEQEKEKRNPNSAAFRQEQERERQKRTEEQIKRQGGLTKPGYRL